MIKLLGCLIIFFSNVIFTRNLSANLKEKVKVLQEFYEILNDFHTAISCGNLELPSLISERCKKEKGVFFPVFTEVKKSLERRTPLPFSILWENALKNMRIPFKKSETDIFTDFGNILSASDKERMLNSLSCLKLKTEEKLKNAKEERNSKAILIEKLGILSGLFFVILFI